MAEWWGYGDDFGFSETGYGDPVVASGVVQSPAGGLVPDDGGVVVTLDGVWPAGAYRVTVGGLQAFPPDAEGFDCRPVGDALSFVVPGGLPLGAATVVVSGPGGAVTLEGALTVVRRNRRSIYYELNRLASPAGPHPARGPVSPTGGSILEPA